MGHAEDASVDRYALFGTHGAGKSSIIFALEEIGETVVFEAAPAIRRISEANGDPYPDDKPDFESRVLRLHQLREDRVCPNVSRVFVDRGGPDHLAYSKIGQWPLSDDEISFCLQPRYCAAFLIEPPPLGAPAVSPVEASFSARQVREAEAIYRKIGIPVIRVPYGPFKRRVSLVLDSAKQARVIS
jgi:predicted ATPase